MTPRFGLRVLVDSYEGFVSVAPSQGSCNTPTQGSSGVVTCDLGSLAASQSAVVEVVVETTLKETFASNKPQVVNTASVRASTLDAVPTNNSATIITDVTGQ